MGTTSDRLSGYGKHFTDVLLKLDSNEIRSHPLLMSATFLLLSYSKLLFVSLFLLGETVIYNADSDHGSGTSLVLWVDATVCYLSKEHLPFAIAAYITLFLYHSLQFCYFLPLQSI